MAVTVTHATVAVGTNAGNGEIAKEQWNENHVVTGVRELLTANRTYYVRTDGSDSNDGLSNTSGGAWLTPQKAYDYVSKNLDLGGYTVTVQFADGTYSGFIDTGYQGASVLNGALYLRGNLTSPQNCVIGGIYLYQLGGLNFICIAGLTMPDIQILYSNTVWLGSSPDFNESGKIRFTGSNPIQVGYGRAFLEIYGTLVFTANMGTAISIYAGGVWGYGSYSVTFENSPQTVSTAFLSVTGNSRAYGINAPGVTGTLTGPRIVASKASTVVGNTGDQTVVPGNSNGTIDATSVVC